jgi:hypothetical protein
MLDVFFKRIVFWSPWCKNRGENKLFENYFTLWDVINKQNKKAKPAISSDSCFIDSDLEKWHSVVWPCCSAHHAKRMMVLLRSLAPSPEFKVIWCPQHDKFNCSNCEQAFFPSNNLHPPSHSQTQKTANLYVCKTTTKQILVETSPGWIRFYGSVLW